MMIKTLKQALPYLIKMKLTPLIWGPQGIGKSQAIAQYCEENSLGFIDLRLGTMEVGDLLGLADFELNSKGEKCATKFMQPNWFPSDKNSKGVLFLDEINRARRDVLQAVFQLVYDRRIHTYQLPEGWAVMAAANPNTDDFIVTDLSDRAFLDRFCHIKLQPTVKEWIDHADKQNFSEDVVRFIKDQPELLRASTEEYNFDDIKPSNRRWEQVSKLMALKPPFNLLQELCTGIVGSAATAAFITSLKDADKPFTAEDILDNYSKLSSKIDKLVTDKKGGRQDILNYTCDNLIKYIQEKKPKFTVEQGKNLLDFLKQIPTEITFRACRELYFEECVRSLMDRDEDLKKLIKKARRMGEKDEEAKS